MLPPMQVIKPKDAEIDADLAKSSEVRQLCMRLHRSHDVGDTCIYGCTRRFGLRLMIARLCSLAGRGIFSSVGAYGDSLSLSHDHTIKTTQIKSELDSIRKWRDEVGALRKELQASTHREASLCHIYIYVYICVIYILF